MTNNLIIETAELQQKLTPQNLMNYRVYYIGKDGLHLGGKPISGKFRWRTASKELRGILHAWARDLVAKYDAVEVGAILSQWARDWATEAGITKVGSPVVDPYPPEYILGCLGESSIERRAYFLKRYGVRDGTTLFHFSTEMLKAVRHAFRHIGVKPRIIWEVSEGGDEVYKILIRGGQDES